MNGPLFPRLKNAWHKSLVCRAGTLVALVIVGGCAGNSLSRLELSNPFHRQASFDLSRYGPTATDRIAELRALAEQVEKMPSAQQQAISQQLAARLREQSDPILRCELVRTLSGLTTPAALSSLHAAVDDDDPNVRMAACDGWSRVGGSTAADALVAVLRSDPSVDVRIAAARSLSRFQDSTALDGLTEALEDSDPALRRRARLSLAQATGEDFGSDVTAWRSFVQRLDAPTDPNGPTRRPVVAGRPDDQPPSQRR